ncbi:hypothetical protein BGW39_007502 [Mortierella sp. 14UC]|nr:hypothetical protein BGW39_007502 [Mortierella sp. 14UC]
MVLDGLSLDRTRDFTIQYEDPAEERLWNGDVGNDDEASEAQGEKEEDNESSQKRGRGLKRNKDENKRKTKAKDNDDGDGGDDNEDDDDSEDVDSEDNEDQDNNDDTDEGFDVNMDMSEVGDKYHEAWNRPVYGFRGLYLEVSVTDPTRSKLNQQSAAGARAIRTNAAAGSQRLPPVTLHAPEWTKLDIIKSSTGSAIKNSVCPPNAVPQSAIPGKKYAN